VILATRSACLFALLAVAANLAACGSVQQAPTTSAGTETVTYRLPESFPLYVQIQGPAGAVAKQAHSLRAYVEPTHLIVVRNAPGHAICTFPRSVKGGVTVRPLRRQEACISLVQAHCQSARIVIGRHLGTLSHAIVLSHLSLA